MKNPETRYSSEFKTEAVSQVIDRRYSVKDDAERIGVSMHRLYLWGKRARADSLDSNQPGSPIPNFSQTIIEKRRPLCRTFSPQTSKYGMCLLEP